MAKIVSIEPVGIEEVFDIPRVPPFSNFLAGTYPAYPDLVVHNCIDETNFHRKGSGTVDKAQELVGSVTRRLRSRFLVGGGEVPGVSILLSSKRSSTDFLERHIKKSLDNPGVLVVDGPRWKFDNRVKYCGKTFRVVVGSDSRDPEILDTVHKRGGEWVVEVEDSGLDAETVGQILNIPVEHYTDFQTDVVGALREVAGAASSTSSPLFPNKKTILDAVLVDSKRPFKRDSYPCFIGSDVPLQAHFDHKAVTGIHLSHRRPIRKPTAPRYLHFDLSKSGDATGLVMLHPASVVSKVLRDEEGIEHSSIEMVFEQDFAVAIRAGENQGESINYQALRDFVFWLRSLGYWVRSVTFDGYQSEDSIQQYRMAGINSSLISVDRGDAPYVQYRQALAEGRVKLAPNDIQVRELATLSHDIVREKVDHPNDGSKDIADAGCGAFLAAIRDGLKPQDWKTVERSKEKKTAEQEKITKLAAAMSRVKTEGS